MAGLSNLPNIYQDDDKHQLSLRFCAPSTIFLQAAQKTPNRLRQTSMTADMDGKGSQATTELIRKEMALVTQPSQTPIVSWI